MWNEKKTEDRLAQSMTNRLAARTWQPSSLPLRPSIAPGEFRAKPTQNSPANHKLKTTLGYSNRSKTEEYRRLFQGATLALAKTPGQNAITWMLVHG